MTSLQIAEATGKLHKDVLRAIRSMEPSWEKINGRKFALVDYCDAKGETRPCYNLTKTECLYVATKFNDEARARLILRWEELEKERSAAKREPESARTLPSAENQQVTPPQLVEMVDGKAVTTSRKLAEVLGRKHDSVLDTIRNNLHLRRFKCGCFARRRYYNGPRSHGYEFLITQRGLQALASIMRTKYRKKAVEVYKGVWRINAKGLPSAAEPEQVAALPPVPEPEPPVRLSQTSESPQKCLPGFEPEATDSPGDVKDVRDTGSEETDEIRYTPEQQKYIDWLEEYNAFKKRISNK